MKFLLVGNPNSGKTTLFNALTGEHQKVGNWPGVTVEQKSGYFSCGDQRVDIIDLPGVYSLSASARGGALDEAIATEAISQMSYDLIVNVVDACHLERHLYLSAQLTELQKPMIVVLTMMDIAAERGIKIDLKRLAAELHCPVIAVQAHKNLGLEALKKALLDLPEAARPLAMVMPEPLGQYLNEEVARAVKSGNHPRLAYFKACREIEKAEEQNAQHQDWDILFADARYQAIHQIIKACQFRPTDAKDSLTARIDRLVLHRFLGIPVFLGIMYLMFLFAICVGGAFQDFFDLATDTVFVKGLAWVLEQVAAPGWLIALLANGLGKGINTTLTFIPVIGAMFFFLAFLEASGYMARAAFVVDKAMRWLGLPGKSFVPLIVGFGCNVPAIMAARTLDSEQDRLLTIMMTPFMSCSARLAIFAVFVAAFFPSGGQNIVFSLYLIGILMAVLTGYLLRKTLFGNQSAPLILELPAYHRPSFKRLSREMLIRLKYFVYRAGKIILPLCVLLGGLNALTLQGSLSFAEASSDSILSHLGQWLTPLFSPMGIHQDNWPATVGLLTGMLAKEVVIGSLNTLYSQMGHWSEVSMAQFSFWGGLQEAVLSIPANFLALGHALVHPFSPSVVDEVSGGVYGMMASRFDGQAGAYAYLLFTLLYIPCVSTMAVIKQEANRRYMWLSISWSFILAYLGAVTFYQIARFSQHPLTSSVWIIVALVMVAGIIIAAKRSTLTKRMPYALADS